MPALVMELVEGPTLADRIAKGPIPLDEALPIARLHDTDSKTGTDISMMTLTGDRTVTPLIHTAFTETNADLSPD